jgi:DNA-binding NtrC family response regulator
MISLSSFREFVPEAGAPCLKLKESESSRQIFASRPTALVVDDEHVIAETLAQILEMSGFRAIPLFSGESALEQVSVRCPDMVITDVVMPTLNGIDMAKQLLKLCPTTRVILISGQAATAEMISAARAEGFNFELLAKPLHPDELLAAIRRLGNEPPRGGTA